MLQIVRLAECVEIKKGTAKEDTIFSEPFFYGLLKKFFSDDPCDPIEAEGKREEMDTPGALFDKLAIVTTRMWHAQDDLYRFRRMGSEEWTKEFGEDPDKVRKILSRACELNLQRNQIMDEIDNLMVNMLNMSVEERKKLYQPKHKMY
jgi:hypothetical protein